MADKERGRELLEAARDVLGETIEDVSRHMQDTTRSSDKLSEYLQGSLLERLKVAFHNVGEAIDALDLEK